MLGGEPSRKESSEGGGRRLHFACCSESFLHLQESKFIPAKEKRWKAHVGSGLQTWKRLLRNAGCVNATHRQQRRLQAEVGKVGHKRHAASPGTSGDVRARPGVPQRPVGGGFATFGLPGDVRGALRWRARAASGVCVEEAALRFQLEHPGDNREQTLALAFPPAGG